MSNISIKKNAALWTLNFSLLFFIISSFLQPTAQASEGEFLPCDPISELLTRGESPSRVAFCSYWNPEFAFRGNQCCPLGNERKVAGQRVRGRKQKRANRCDPFRVKSSYCDEMTADQKQYEIEARSGKLGDILKLITSEKGKKGEQSYCSVNNGFLAHGRQIIPSAANRVKLRSPERCVNFGTDGMVALIEHLGRQINKVYGDSSFKQTHLLLGDVSAPRGGCLSGKGGGRGHASHTSGVDADIGFFNPKPNRASEPGFSRGFDPQTNWWFIKAMLQNPYVCVKVIFLDRRLINRLAKAVGRDPDWNIFRRFLKHVRGHSNHMHVRVSPLIGRQGCVLDSKTDTDFEDEGESDESSEEMEN